MYLEGSWTSSPKSDSDIHCVLAGKYYYYYYACSTAATTAATITQTK